MSEESRRLPCGRRTPSEQEKPHGKPREPEGGPVIVYVLEDPRTCLVGHVGASTNPRKQLSKQLYHAKTGVPGPVFDWLRSLISQDLRPTLRLLTSVRPENAKSYIASHKKLIAPNLIPHRPRAVSRAIKTPSDVRRALKAPHSPIPVPPPHVLRTLKPRSRYGQWVMHQLRKYGLGSNRTGTLRSFSAATNTDKDS